MSPLTVTFDIPAKILMGLANGSLTRSGGVIQDKSGRIIMWLREIGEPGRLNPMAIPMQGMLNATMAASTLSLGVSVVGFIVLTKKINDLENRLEKIQKHLDKIDAKIDLGFYANFRAALDLAVNAFTMTNADNRRSSALAAINRFLEAEHLYAELADQELNVGSQIGNIYLLTLCLAYIAESRCYLQLGEFDTAIRRFQEGKKQINSRTEKYLNLLLTSQPLMYLHSDLKGETDLSRLTRIYQWKDHTLTENSVFELIRKHIFSGYDLLKNSQFNKWTESIPAFILNTNNSELLRNLQFNEWIELLPSAVLDMESLTNAVRNSDSVEKILRKSTKKGKEEILKKLPLMLAEMESMIETNCRFNAYELEVKAMAKLGLSFHEWLQLQPIEDKRSEMNMMCILPSEPLYVQ